MAYVFFISYGGYAKNGYKYVPYKAIVRSPEEAIATINTWKSYGRKNSTAPGDRIVVNEVTEKKIRSLFADGLGTYPSGEPCTYVGVRTTGCGAWEIGFSYPLADTLQEHERIYKERQKALEAARKDREREIRREREAGLNEVRRGWYHVELTFTVCVSPRHGNDYLADRTFSGDVLAESGAEAYGKAVNEIENSGMTYHGNIAMLFAIPDAWSDDFSFTFLGMRTDDGYSVEEWEKWKEKGEI